MVIIRFGNKDHFSKLNGKKIVLLTATIISPSMKSLIDEFSKRYTNVEHIMYDAIPYDGILNANKILLVFVQYQVTILIKLIL